MRVGRAKSLCLSTVALEYNVSKDLWLCANCKMVFGPFLKLTPDKFDALVEHFRDVSHGQYLEMLIFTTQIRLLKDPMAYS